MSATRAIVIGQVEKNDGLCIEPVFNATCNNLQGIMEAVEQAFDRDATTIIIKRIMPMRRRI